MRPLLIGFTGPKRAGKTLATELLMSLHGVAGIGFAQPMRVFVAELLGLSLDELEEFKEKQVPGLPEGITIRKMLQTLGTEWGRNTIDPDFWVKVAMRNVDMALDAGYAVAITDVRFPNEATAIRERGGVIIEITREGTAYSDGHVSDQRLPAEMIDYTVANDGDPGDLYKAVAEVLRGVQARRQIEASIGTQPDEA